MPATFALLAINLCIFGWMFMQEPGAWTGRVLLNWGGNLGRLSLGGEYWRLVSAMFLHGDIKHLAGNLRSRFTDFLTTDGEKPTRDRDSEFDMSEAASRVEVMRWWDTSWAITLDAIDRLTVDDLGRTVTIRGESFAVPEALNRLATHAAYHVGQIVFLAKHFAGPRFTSLSIPKNKSKDAKGEFKKGIVPGR